MPRSYVNGYVEGAKYNFDRASYKFYRSGLEHTMKSFKTKMLDYEAMLIWCEWVLTIEVISWDEPNQLRYCKNFKFSLDLF